MHLQCFTPTLYVLGVATRINVTTIFPPTIMYACSYTMWTFPDNFFFCLVCAVTWKKIRGAFGSTWGHNFLIYGHAEWIETRNLTEGIFDSHL